MGLLQCMNGHPVIHPRLEGQECSRCRKNEKLRIERSKNPAEPKPRKRYKRSGPPSIRIAMLHIGWRTRVRVLSKDTMKLEYIFCPIEETPINLENWIKVYGSTSEMMKRTIDVL